MTNDRPDRSRAWLAPILSLALACQPAAWAGTAAKTAHEDGGAASADSGSAVPPPAHGQSAKGKGKKPPKGCPRGGDKVPSRCLPVSRDPGTDVVAF